MGGGPGTYAGLIGLGPYCKVRSATDVLLPSQYSNIADSCRDSVVSDISTYVRGYDTQYTWTTCNFYSYRWNDMTCGWGGVSSINLIFTIDNLYWLHRNSSYIG